MAVCVRGASQSRKTGERCVQEKAAGDDSGLESASLPGSLIVLQERSGGVPILQ